MIDRLIHEDFIGSVHFSAADETFFGKIEGINDLVTFEGTTVKELKKSFIEAVNDYKALCKQTGADTFKSFKGSFNVRIKPALHKLAYQNAIKQGISLNQFVQVALEKELVKK